MPNLEKDNKWIDRVAVRIAAGLSTQKLAPEYIAKQAYDIAEAMSNERFNRFKPKPDYEFTEPESRCCGRCNGTDDICVADRVCEPHKITGCEICYGKRSSTVIFEQLTKEIIRCKQITGTEVMVSNAEFVLEKADYRSAEIILRKLKQYQ